MKVADLLENQQLDELSLKHAVTGALIGAAALAHSGESEAAKKKGTKPVAAHHVDERLERLTSVVVKKYKIDRAQAREIVKIAKKYERKDFPRAEDILAIIGIESSFKSHAVSKDGKDIGLMQVRHTVHNLEKADLDTVEKQIAVGVKILSSYYKHLKSKEKAIQAYNLGLTKVLKGEENPKYLERFDRELALYKV